MFSRILLAALVAGALAGGFIFTAHMVKTTPLILHAEVYENAGSSDAHESAAPAELAAEFVAATMVVTGLFWLLLGGLTGHFYRRFENF